MSSSSGGGGVGGTDALGAMSASTSLDGLQPNPLHSTSKYKQYVQAVDRALKTFENPNEWADLISALAKLTKVLQTNAKFHDVPKRVLVAKRLSQCLHPALPMGVHVKALETYKTVFDILGPQLPHLLYLFAVGLFPLMDHCGIKVKNELFTIVEQYLVPLGEHLRPALPGFLAGVLLGLEEGTEFYERSLILMDRVCDAVGSSSFYACLWQAVLGSPSVRLPAMLYVNAKFDKSKPLEDQLAVVGDHVDHMVAALSTTAEDSGSPLVQRNLLDFLHSAFPLDSTNLTREDFVQLMKKCLFVVLRRDMSLNRRLYTWLMNPSGGTGTISSVPIGGEALPECSFFKERSLPIVVDALKACLSEDVIETPQTVVNQWAHGWGEKKDGDLVQFTEVRICRLLTYLQDRMDLGRPILKEIFPDFLIKCASHQNYTVVSTAKRKVTSPTAGANSSRTSFQIIQESVEEDLDEDTKIRRVDEIAKTLNVLLSSLENDYLWSFLSEWYQLIIETQDIVECSRKLTQFSKVLLFVLEAVNLDLTADVRLKHLPQLLSIIMRGLTKAKNADQHAVLHVLAVCQRLLEEIGKTSAIQIESPSEPNSVMSSPLKIGSQRPSVEQDQALVEKCIRECETLLAACCRMYVDSERDASRRVTVAATARLFLAFTEHPLYCFGTYEKRDDEKTLPDWVNQLVTVLEANAWCSDVSNWTCEDVETRLVMLETLVSIYVRSQSVLGQHHDGARDRSTESVAPDNANEDNEAILTVLLKPLLSDEQLKQLDNTKVFELSAKALWQAMGDIRQASVHQQIAKLLVALHSRRTTDASSDAENIIVCALTNSDQVICTEAGNTFNRMWALTRNSDDEIIGISPKPFNRAVMVLLGVIADESVSRSRSELRGIAAVWFADCANHNDLPRIVQMLATILMNPVTARVSIQYLWKESRFTREQLTCLPNGVSAVTLVTADLKQRLYHVEGHASAGPWLTELRNRMLSSTKEVEKSPDAAPVLPASSGDNFDDDTDSLDTLSISMEGVESAVVETVAYLIDCVVEDEDSEMERAARFELSLESAPPIGEHVVFRNSVDSSVCSTSDVTSRKNVTASSISDPALSRVKRGHRRQDSLQESIFSLTEKELKTFDTTELLRPLADSSESLYQFTHVHMLLYGESGRVVDLSRAESAFRILTALLTSRSAPLSHRMLLSCLVSSGTASQCEGVGLLAGSMVDLMNRHVRAILGQQFWGTPADDDTKTRHLTLLELLITISLHYLRSFFLNSPISPVTEGDLVNSWKCKVAVLDFLSELFAELSSMLVEQQSRAFALFVQSIVQRAKLQKCLLHMLLSYVHVPVAGTESDPKAALASSVLEFNDGGSSSTGRRLSATLGAYQNALLAFTAQVVRLESEVKIGYNSFNDQNASGIILNRLSISQQLYNTPSHRATLRDPPASLIELRLFLVIVLHALKRHPERHETWRQFVIRILPWMERSLPTVVVRVVDQLCKNMELALQAAYVTSGVTTHSSPTRGNIGVAENILLNMENFPANYLTATMESLTTLMHFCMLEVCTPGSSIQTGSTIQTQSTPPQSQTGMVGQAISAIPGTKGASELLSNLVKVFSFSDSNTAPGGVTLSKMEGGRPVGVAWRNARNDLLTALPHSLATICDVWSVVRKGEPARLPLGSTQQLKRLVLDLLSPIAQHHQHQLLNAMSLVWLTRSDAGPVRRADADVASFHYTDSQMDVANLLLSLKVISVDDLISAVTDSLKEAGAKASKALSEKITTFPTEAPLLELVHGCVRELSSQQIRQCWPSMQVMFAEAPVSQLQPRAVFLLFIILCDIVRSAGAACIVEDKTMSRAMQDACARLTESINSIVGWQLETTTWLKRTLVVKQEHPTAGSRSVDASPMVESMSLPTATSLQTASEQSSIKGSTMSLIKGGGSVDAGAVSLSSSTADKKSSSNLRASVKDPNNNKRDPAHSTQALFLLAENLAELMDTICKSDDKERLLPSLTAVWGNVVPYLKAKNSRNARFFLASSQLLASMSSFNYMRPVWKKTTLELLLDQSFFKMDVNSLKEWLIITDHLMTHDRTSFKDLLKSIAYTPNTSFSLMTSREAEADARAQALKRLAFVVLGSELDQYQGQMNDIQERLSENLRVSQAPSTRSAVFLCLRVLLIRLRPPSLVGIWPLMITELVHVLLQMEQQLSGDTASDELQGEKNDAWMQLYLAAAKLLETLCTLPAGYLAQFQMCHWAFVSAVAAKRTDLFMPFAARIHRLLTHKYGALKAEESWSSSASLRQQKVLSGFEELRPFYQALATQHEIVPNRKVVVADADILTGSLSYKNAVSRLEQALYVDFSDQWHA